MKEMHIPLPLLIILWLLPLPINYLFAKRIGMNLWWVLLMTLLFSGIITSYLAWLLLLELSQAAMQRGDKFRRANDNFVSFITEPERAMSSHAAAVFGKSCLNCGRQNRTNDSLCIGCGSDV